jgi:hypothetical protein
VLWILSAHRAWSQPHRRAAGRGDRCAAPLALYGAEIAELLGMALSTGVGDPDPIGLGRSGDSGLEPAERYERERPGELVTSTSRSSGASRAAPGKRVRDGLRQHYNPTLTDLEGKRRYTVGWGLTVQSAIDDGSRTGPTPKVLRTRKDTPRSRSSVARCSSTPATASASSA